LEIRNYFIESDKQLQSGGTNANIKILPPNLQMVDVEVMGKKASAIVHPEFGHLFTIQAIARFIGCNERSIGRACINYGLEEGADFHHLHIRQSVGIFKTLFLTTSGLSKLKSSMASHLIRKNGAKPNKPTQPTLFTPQAASLTDSPLDLLMRIEDTEVRLGLFAHFKREGF
jgi:hypothetical protein